MKGQNSDPDKLPQTSSRELTPTDSNATYHVPALVAAAGEEASRHFLNFFIASIRNRNTRRAYVRQVRLFLSWCEQRGLRDIRDVRTEHVAAYVELLTRSSLETASVKQSLSALKMLFDWLVVHQVVKSNPTAAVRGPKLVTSEGKTPALSSEEVAELIEHIPTNTLVGLRDRVLLSGDEDVRIAVQITQSFGVRVHLIGIAPCRSSQSSSLRQEADTTIEWDVATVEKFLSVKPSSISTLVPSETEPDVAPSGVATILIPHFELQNPSTSPLQADLESVAKEILSELLTVTDIDRVCADCGGHLIPHNIDRRLLGRSRERIGRLLDEQEIRYIRKCFKVAIEDEISR